MSMLKTINKFINTNVCKKPRTKWKEKRNSLSKPNLPTEY